MIRVLMLTICFVLPAATLAIDAEGPLEDPELQARYEKLTHELRCIKCQNQTIADSPAGLAGDLRQQTRSLLLDGKTDEEIRQYMQDRFGDFVLYRTPFSAKTALLWASPFLLLAIGLVAVFRVILRRSREALPEPEES